MGEPRAPVREAAAHLHTRLTPAAGGASVDVDALAADLAAEVAGEVRFDRGSRALYATDSSNYRHVPIGVVIPHDNADVERSVSIARRHGAPVLARGGGTSLAGQSCNAGVVLDFSKRMHRVIDIDAARRIARVQPGVVLDDLRAAAARHGLTFGPDPATHAWCTLGGMIGNNSCGVHSVMADLYGSGPTTADNVDALEVTTYRGARIRVGALDDHTYRRVVSEGGEPAQLFSRLKAFQERYADLIRREFPRIPRRVSGYNLPALLPENGFHVARALVGSESTLALVLEADVHLIPGMPHRALVVLGFEDIYAAADQVPAVLEYRPVGLEGFDDRLARDLRAAGLSAGNLKLLPEGDGWLLVEFGADTPDEAVGRAREFADDVRRRVPSVSLALFDRADDQHRLWEIRESGLAATAHVAGENPTWPGWEDSAVPPDRFGAYLRDVRALFEAHGYHADLYGHFGQGCLHCRVDFDLRSKPGIARFRRFMEEAADLVHRYGGSLSGEHGDGQARGELLGRMFSPEMLQAFREFKSIWDPDWKMNPGKVIDARPLDADLRLGAGYRQPAVSTWFRYPGESGSFARETLRCVGVGKCRKHESGTMCPSYMVTREEKHSTRGRARLLFEMLEGDPLTGGWQAEEVREALDLCLACKACRAECPVHVDMATYKAEFLSHYYERHWRPRHAWAFGLINTWARLASLAPRAVNFVTQSPSMGALAKRMAGMAGDRRVPAFAPQTFRTWFLARSPSAPGGGSPVILWPDTFNDHFHPETLRAAVDVLEASGFTVKIPRTPLCCGRPLYDYGLLGQAKRRLEEVMASLAHAIAEGLPVVVLEPSCASVFRDELRNLFPDREDARRLEAQTVTLPELLTRANRLPSATLERRALVHGHCHQKAVLGTTAEREMLDAMRLRHEVLDSGCCGMAGSFGFEREHLDVSRAVGERVLLPAVRGASRDTIVVADGFSCREQIAQETDRRAIHTVELLHMAIVGGPGGPEGDLPERGYAVDHAAERLPWTAVAGVLLAGAAAVSLAVRWMREGGSPARSRASRAWRRRV